MVTRFWLIAAPAFLAFLFLQFAGSAVVVDETSGVLSAIVTDDSWEQPLIRLWSGYFYAVPQMEGTIEVRCRDGSRKRWGYVTGHVHTKIRAIGERPCARVVHDN